jgi:4-carboxymuconolactone decarboxylase
MIFHSKRLCDGGVAQCLRDNRRAVMRLPSINVDRLEAGQRAVYDRIASGARGGVRGPFLALLHSPDLAGRVEQLGLYVRFECRVPQRLRELAILVVARFWQADYEWFAHAPIAEKQGLPHEAIEAFGRGGDVSWPTAQDELVVDFCSHLLKTRRIPDDIYSAMQGFLGIQGTIDLVALVGYYTLLALTLNAHDVDVPADAGIPWQREADSPAG